LIKRIWKVGDEEGKGGKREGRDEREKGGKREGRDEKEKGRGPVSELCKQYHHIVPPPQ
jgi:hypothetical protein